MLSMIHFIVVASRKATLARSRNVKDDRAAFKQAKRSVKNAPRTLTMNMSMVGIMGWDFDPGLTAGPVEIEYVRVYGRQ